MNEPSGGITVFLADDNIIVREGVRAMLARNPDIEIVGVADDYDSLVAGASTLAPNVVVSDIRMPPSFQSEGIDGCKEIRKRHPGTGVVILSQFDDPDYAIALLSEGAAGYAYLLKDHIAQGDQLVAAIRAVATGGSVLDPSIVDAMVRPAVRKGDLSADEEALLAMLAEGKPIKAIAVARTATPAAVNHEVELLFASLATSASAGAQGALRRLRMLHDAIVSREEQGESLSRLLPGGLAEKLLASGRELGESEMLTVTVVMSDIRGYSTISEHADLSTLARQLNTHRAEMNRAIIGEGGTVMQYVGDAVMAVFGAPVPSLDHADRAVAAVAAMHLAQQAVNASWLEAGLPPFPIGIGVSTGEVAAALLGSEERAEYTMVGDVVNLCQRLQQFAASGQSVLSEATWDALSVKPDAYERLDPQMVKGRDSAVQPYRIGPLG
ncbi:MAG: adenylate/guanylate cyclase [Ilumatobacteraceae bacterium]|nr:adenylate/guanylate cyclase [Ilumatobacteraceae bacterium]